jgi:hypothetical protein
MIMRKIEASQTTTLMLSNFLHDLLYEFLSVGFGFKREISDKEKSIFHFEKEEPEKRKATIIIPEH